jgi:hypothetical protein
MKKSFVALFSVALILAMLSIVPFTLADPARCKVTGGGWIIPCGEEDKATFGFNAMKYGTDQTPNDPLVKGELEYNDHVGMKVHGDVNLFTYVFPDNFMKNQQADFAGTCTVNGEDGFWFYCYVQDNGEPGKADVFSIRVYDTAITHATIFTVTPIYTASGELGGGNIQTHPLPPPMNPEV